MFWVHLYITLLLYFIIQWSFQTLREYISKHGILHQFFNDLLGIVGFFWYFKDWFLIWNKEVQNMFWGPYCWSIWPLTCELASFCFLIIQNLLKNRECLFHLVKVFTPSTFLIFKKKRVRAKAYFHKYKPKPFNM